jgi:hypothetical protein
MLSRKVEFGYDGGLSYRRKFTAKTYSTTVKMSPETMVPQIVSSGFFMIHS